MSSRRRLPGVPGPFLLFARLLMPVTATFLLTGMLGCVVVGASSAGGWFVWPGGLGLLVVLLLLFFVLRRR